MTTEPTITETASRFRSASIPALRQALLADADVHEQRAEAYSGADTGTELAAWCGLLLAASHNRMSAALLGLLGDPRVPAEMRERGRSLVGQVLDGWPEALEGANDDLPDAPEAQIPGQQAIPDRLPGFLGAGDCESCEGTGLNIGLPGNCPACSGTGNTPAAESGSES